MKARRPPAVRHVRRRPDPPTPAATPSRLGTFRGWHREPSLYREVYARAISAVLAAGVIYVLGAAIGIFRRQPAAYLVVIVSAVGLAWCVFAFVESYRMHRRDRRGPLIPEEALARQKKVKPLIIINTLLLIVAIVVSEVTGR